MAGDQGIRAGKAYVEITTDQSKLEAGLKSAQKRLWAMGEAFDRYGKAMLKVGAVGLSPFLVGLKKLAEVDPQVAADLKSIKDALDGVFVALGQVLYGAIKPYIGSIVYALRVTAEWIRQNQALVEKILKVVSTIALVGAGLAAVGAVIKGVASFIAVLTAILSVARKAWLAFAMAAAVCKAVLMAGDWKKILGMVLGITAAVGLAVWGFRKFDSMLKGYIGKFKIPKLPDLTMQGAAQSVTATNNTYAHLNGEAFTHLFGGLKQTSVAQQQLDELKSIKNTTGSINTQLFGLIGG